MKPHFDFIFKPFGPLEMHLYRGRASIERVKKSCVANQTISWSSGSSEWWSMQPSAHFTNLQAYLWERTAGASAPPSVALTGGDGGGTGDQSDGYVLLIKRATPPEGYVGPWTGAQRRRLPESFWNAVVPALRTQRITFRVVELEAMHLAHQVALFRGARAVIGVHGAGLSNILFCKAGTLVFELGRVDHPCYVNLASKLNLRHRHHDAESGEELARVVLNTLSQELIAVEVPET